MYIKIICIIIFNRINLFVLLNMIQEKSQQVISEQSEIILYIYLLSNLDMISCQCCYCIPYGSNKMHRIKKTRLYYCKNCINKWMNNYKTMLK